MQNDFYKPPEADVVRPSEPGQIELASRWRRLFGSILDAALITVLIVPFMFGSGYWERVMEATAEETEPYLWALATILAYCAVNAYPLHKRGQTIGKFVLGTQIVAYESHNLLPVWKIIFLRWLPVSVASNLPTVGGVLWLINALLIFRDGQRCGHDHIAGSIVINYVEPANLPRTANSGATSQHTGLTSG